MRDMPLYPSEAGIARAVDERHGLPKIDPVHGGRYWPAVRHFCVRLSGQAH
jgi:hypothetical protein